MSGAEILEDMQRRIRAFQIANETPQGFKLLYCPVGNLGQHSGLLVLGLNPGGTHSDEQLDEPNGLSWEVGHWALENPTKARLQNQGMTLLRYLRPSTYRTSVVSNICVFRSTRWTQQEAARYGAFAVDFWSAALRDIEPFKLVVFISTKAHALGRKLFAGTPQTPTWTWPVWGNASVQYFKGTRGLGVPDVLVLPHLSRFRFVTEGNARWETLKPLLADLVE